MYILTISDKNLTLVTIAERIVEFQHEIRLLEADMVRYIQSIVDHNSSWMIRHKFKEEISIANDDILKEWQNHKMGLLTDLNNLYDLQRKLNVVWFEKNE